MTDRNRCGTCDESYDPQDPRQANRHDHDEPQSGDERNRWMESGKRWGLYARERIGALTLALAKERETCAKVANEAWETHGGCECGLDIADAIRARGDQPKEET